jgi:hypothetical protein
MNKIQKARMKLNLKLQEFEDEIPCFYEDPRLFDPDEAGNPYSQEFKKAVAIAKSLCFECPARQECFDYGYKSSATAMIWGGVTIQEMNTMKYRQEKPAQSKS